MTRKACLDTAAWVLLAALARGDVKLPAIVSDGMVLQRDAAVPIWGWADPDEEITVRIAGATKTTRAAADGKWMVHLDPLPAGGPHVLEIAGKDTHAIQDVLVGEVWLGSGQSNMAMGVRLCANAETEMAAANYPRIRSFREESGPSEEMQSVGTGHWAVCTPETVGTYSGTLYFFGRELQRALDVPIGLINSSLGGTPIQSWTSEEAQRACPELEPFLALALDRRETFDPDEETKLFERRLARWEKDKVRAAEKGKKPRGKPPDPVEGYARRGDLGWLFNAKIAPLIPYGIRGVLWYQGESNSLPDVAPYYRYQLPLLVKDWRARWGQADLPFAWVQLPNFARHKVDRPTVREAERRALSLPRTGMAVTIDVGDPLEIHPANKQDVGGRLALWALGAVYGKEVAISGPLFTSFETRASEIVLHFAHVDGGLRARDGDLRTFEVRGAEGDWHPASARIDGETVIVSSPEIAQPIAARYAWENDPDCNLFNGAGLPASPFTTVED
jgi:sialate O-acetylesterase